MSDESYKWINEKEFATDTVRVSLHYYGVPVSAVIARRKTSAGWFSVLPYIAKL